MKFITDYPNLCQSCQATILAVAELLEEGPDTDDPEAPAMWMYDHALYCGGRQCRLTEERLAGNPPVWNVYLCSLDNPTDEKLEGPLTFKNAHQTAVQLCQEKWPLAWKAIPDHTLAGRHYAHTAGPEYLEVR